MCLIIHKPVGADVPITRMKDALWSNNDGWGIMAKHPDGTIEVVKDAIHVGGDMLNKPWEEFLGHFDRLKDLELGIHFRRRTSGGITVDNTHPFPVLQKSEGDPIDLWLMHNGVFSRFGNHTRSDTNEFVADFLTPIFRKYSGCWEDDRMWAMVEGFVGGFNKLLLMSPDLKDPVIINEKVGTKIGPVWYSAGYSNYYQGGSKRTYYHASDFTEGAEPEKVVQLTLPVKVVPGSAEHAAEGGRPQVAAPFCTESPLSPAKTKSSESPGASSRKDTSSNDNSGQPETIAGVRRAIRETATILTDADFRTLYLGSDDDPRIGGNDVPFEALRYLKEDHLLEVVENNPQGVVDLLMGLTATFNSEYENDLQFRESVLLYSAHYAS